MVLSPSEKGGRKCCVNRYIKVDTRKGLIPSCELLIFVLITGKIFGITTRLRGSNWSATRCEQTEILTDNLSNQTVRAVISLFVYTLWGNWIEGQGQLRIACTWDHLSGRQWGVSLSAQVLSSKGKKKHQRARKSPTAWQAIIAFACVFFSLDYS